MFALYYPTEICILADCSPPVSLEAPVNVNVVYDFIWPHTITATCSNHVHFVKLTLQ